MKPIQFKTKVGRNVLTTSPQAGCPSVLADDPAYFADDPRACAGNLSVILSSVSGKVTKPQVRTRVKIRR